MGRIGALIVLIAGAAAIVGPWVLPADPFYQDLPLRLASPSWGHPLGLDELGRDLFARLVLGARVSLFVGIVVVGVSATVGSIIPRVDNSGSASTGDESSHCNEPRTHRPRSTAACV